MRQIFVGVVLLGVFALPRVAQAGCTKDVDCKGDRICVEGVCRDPAQPDALPEAQPDTQSDGRVENEAEGDDAPYVRRRRNEEPRPEVRSEDSQDAEPHLRGETSRKRHRKKSPAGWTRGAGVFGLVSGFAVMGFASASALTNGDETLAIPIGGAGTILFAVTLPITAIGAASGVEGGPLGLKLGSWILYGVALVEAATLLSIGLSDGIVPSELILATGITGLISSGLMSINSFIAASRSKPSEEFSASHLPNESDGLRIMPTVSLARDRGDGALPVFGLVGAF